MSGTVPEDVGELLILLVLPLLRLLKIVHLNIIKIFILSLNIIQYDKFMWFHNPRTCLLSINQIWFVYETNLSGAVA
jgi:hypothetical protein